MPAFSHLYSSALDHELGTDDSTRLFTTARRQNAINEGIQQFADLTECYVRQSTITCSNGTGEYNLLSTVNVPGDDFVRLAQQRPEYQHTSPSSQVTYISGENFVRRDVEWLNQYTPGWRQSTGGTPQYYYERMDGGRRFFGMSPPPQIASSASAKVVLPYVARPVSLTSDTDVPFTNSTLGTRADITEYHQAFVHYAAYQLEKLRVQPEESQRQLQAFLGYVQRFLGALRPKGGTTVKMARSYFGEVRRRGVGAGGPNPWRTDLWGDRP